MDSAPLITAPVPTVTGREAFLEETIRSYEETANIEVLVYHDLPTCGAGWLKGITEGTGEYFVMGADDITMHPGWWVEAARFADLGYLPCARILNTDGSLQSCGTWEQEMATGAIPEFTRSPFFTRAQWERLEPLVAPILPELHYFSDNIFTWAGRKLGMETVVCRAYEYTHHLAPQKRGAGMTWNDRMAHDHATFMAYINS